MEDSPAAFSRKPEIPSSSLSTMPESLKLNVWSKSLASRYRFIKSFLVNPTPPPEPAPEGASAHYGAFEQAGWYLGAPPAIEQSHVAMQCEFDGHESQRTLERRG